MMENEHQASPSSLQLVWKARFPWHPSLNGRRSFCRSKQAASNMLVALHPGAPPAPVAILGVHSSSNGLIFPETLNSAMSGRRLSRSLAISRLRRGRCWPRWVLKSCASIRPLESCKNLPPTKVIKWTGFKNRRWRFGAAGGGPIRSTLRRTLHRRFRSHDIWPRGQSQTTGNVSVCRR